MRLTYGRFDASTAESLLAKAKEEGRARLRVYIGAAPGVGKSYQMLEDAHALKRQGLDVVVGFVEAHGRAETLAMIGDLEQVPLRHIEYRGVTLPGNGPGRDPGEARRRLPSSTSSRTPTRRARRTRSDTKTSWRVLDAGIDVITAVNIQHIESLNDVIASTTGVRVRETVPDWVLKRADEVVNVDVSVETLRERLRQGKNLRRRRKWSRRSPTSSRKGNLTALRELALRQLASDQAGKAHEYRQREGLEQPVIPEKVMVAMASRGSAKNLLRVGSRIAGRLATDWFAVYVETPREGAGPHQAGRPRGASRQHPLRAAARREGREAEGLARGRRARRVREARGDHARDFRPVGAVAMGPAHPWLDRRSLPARRARRDRADRSGSAARRPPPRTTRATGNGDEAANEAAGRLRRVRAGARRARRPGARARSAR